MQKITCVLVLLGIFADAQNIEIQDRIIGGHETSISKVPYQLSVGIMLSKTAANFLCGGVLISDMFGLSAAHCFPQGGAYFVRAGSDMIESGGQVVNVKHVLIHPNYASFKQEDSDIAVLKFSKSLRLSNNIKPIKLAKSTDVIKPGMIGLVSGWGQMSSYVTSISSTLRSVELPVFDQNSCKINYRTLIEISSKQFCAGLPQGGKDSCQGDSGGPFAVNHKLYGLVSFGRSCAEPGVPGVYVSIPAHREYIRANTGI